MRSARNASVGRQNPLPAPTGITFESVAAGSYVGLSYPQVSTSWTHTIGASANCLLVAVNANAIYAPGVTIDTGQAFTYIDGGYYTSFANTFWSIYALKNPTPGTRTISVVCSAFGSYSCGGSSIAYSGVSGFAASGNATNGSVSSLALGLPAFPGGVAVMQTNGGWASATQISRQNGGGASWQESRNNTSTSATVKGTANSALGTSVTIPAHAVGDVIVVFAYSNASSTPPTPPTASGTVPAWVAINSGGSLDNSSGVYYFVATTATHTSGTWGLTSGMAAVVIEGADTSPTLPIGARAAQLSGYSGTTGAYAPAISSGNVTLASGGWSPSTPASGITSNFNIFHTTDVGADIFVSIQHYMSATQSVTVCTVDGVAATLVQSQFYNDTSSGLGCMYLYRLAGAGNGLSQTVNIRLSAAQYVSATVGSYNNVGSVGAVRNYGNSAAASVGPVTCPAGGMLLANISGGGTASGGGTQRAKAATYQSVFDSTTDTTFGATYGTAGAWAAIAVQLNPKTLTNKSGSSCLLQFVGHGTNGGWSAAPTGWTRQTAIAGTGAPGSPGVALNTKNDTTTESQMFQDDTGFQAIAFDRHTSLYDTQNTASYQFTAAAGADVFFAISASWGAQRGLQSVSYGGVAMTAIATLAHNNTGTTGQTTLYRIAAAGSGAAKTLTFSWAQSTSYVIDMFSYTGVGSVGTATTAFGSSTAPSIGPIASNSGDVILGVIGTGTGGVVSTVTASSGGTNRSLTNGPTVNPQMGLVVSDSTTTATTFSATQSAVAAWSNIAVVLRPAQSYRGHTVEILGNPATTRNFSTAWATANTYTQVGVVLK